MCVKKKSRDVKLIDFGLSAKLDPDQIVKVSTATAEFAAPEIADHEPVGFYTDMWAVGVLAYILLVVLHSLLVKSPPVCRSGGVFKPPPNSQCVIIPDFDHGVMHDNVDGIFNVQTQPQTNTTENNTTFIILSLHIW